MTTLRSILYASVLIFATVGSATAFDPRGVDILTLRLGMTEPEVTRLLTLQGFADATYEIHRMACRADATASCVSAIRARTRDGTLDIGFTEIPGAARTVVDRIIYVLDGKRPGEPDAIRMSVINRYGSPSVENPMSWCARPTSAGTCAPDQPRLTFRPGAWPSSVLSLTTAEPDGRTR